MHHPGRVKTAKDGFSITFHTFKTWFSFPFLFPLTIIDNWKSWLNRKNWDFRGLLYRLKWTAGFVILYVMSVYWKEYAEYKIEFNNVSPVFNGWALLSYAVCWTPTLEGSFKRAIVRGFGSALGAFCGWLSIIVCSWSYDYDAAVNPYGLAVWLTVAGAINGWVFADKGVASRFGGSHDNGKIGLYVILTHTLVSLEIFAGKGDRDSLVVNRVVATIVGVVVAVIFAFIPPNNRAGDTKQVKEWWTATRDGFVKLCDDLLDESKHTEMKAGYADKLVAPAAQSRRIANWYLKDADYLPKLPIFRVDPAITVLTHGLDSRNGAFRSPAEKSGSNRD